MASARARRPASEAKAGSLAHWGSPIARTRAAHCTSFSTAIAIAFAGYGWYRWENRWRPTTFHRNAAAIEDTHFTEIVAGNRTFPVRVFDDEDDAKDWLLSTPQNG